MLDRLGNWRRRLRRSADRFRWAPPHPSTHHATDSAGIHGLLLIQIDGLGLGQLQRAEAEGLMPNLARLQRTEPYRTAPLYAGVPSSTPAFQAELLYGVQTAVPAYSFVHRASNRVFRMSDRDAASTVEAGLAGRGLLEGGSSYGNIYRGGAAVTRFSMAAFGLGDFFSASRPRDLPFVVLAHGLDVLRASAMAAAELVVGVPQLFTAVRDGQPLGEEIRFLQARVSVTVVLREALTTLAAIDLKRGLPVIHLDFLGYDEWAHRRGPGSPEALRALRGIDHSIGRLTRAARRAEDRNYDLWVFSDHGQEETIPYIETYGRSVSDAIAEVLSQHGISHEVNSDPPKGIQGQRAAMMGTKAAEFLVPGLEVTPHWWNKEHATTTALGPLGHIYLPDPVSPEIRLTIAKELVDGAGIPMVITVGETGETIALTASGTFVLPGDGLSLLGPDHPFAAEAASDLVRLTNHTDAGDLVISGWSRDTLPVSFPHENGSHAGPGPNETAAFVCAPTDTPLPWDRSALRASDLRDCAFEILEGRRRRPIQRWTTETDTRGLRVLTYNIHSCRGLDGTLSPERIARVIARIKPDIVALQEVDVGRQQTGGVDQAAVIAEHLGMHMQFHATSVSGVEQFGDALLSRYPMQQVKTGPLPSLKDHPELEPRGALQVEIDTGSVRYTVINTHLSIHPSERRIQTEALLGPDWLGGLSAKRNVVLLGDFNAGPGFPTCRSLGQSLVDVQVGLDGHRPKRTWGGRWPVARIDHIFASPGIEILHVDVPTTHLTQTASDHLPLYADIRARASY